MGDLEVGLGAALVGRACLVGVGNPELGDDAVGPRIVEGVGRTRRGEAIVAGTEPERWMGRLSSGEFDSVLFVDALEFGGRPGSAALLEGRDVRARYPQVSTHKISLGTLAGLIESQAETRVHLLGVQPGSLRGGGALSATVRETVAGLTRILRSVLDGESRGSAPARQDRGSR